MNRLRLLIAGIVLLAIILLVTQHCSLEEEPLVDENATDEPSVDVQALLQNLTLDDYDARLAASDTLTAIGPDAVPEVIAYLRSQPFNDTSDISFRARWESVNVLGRIEDGRAADALVERIVYDEENHVRWRAIWALDVIDYDSEVDALLHYLKNEDKAARWNAAVALASFQEPASIEVLRTGLQEKDEWKRWEAVYALGLIGDSKAASYALGALNDDAIRVRQEAIMTIAKSKDPQFIDVLLPLVNDSTPGMRWRAAEGLVRLGAFNMTGLLEQMQARELDGDVRKELARIKEGLPTNESS